MVAIDSKQWAGHNILKYDCILLIGRYLRVIGLAQPSHWSLTVNDMWQSSHWFVKVDGMQLVWHGMCVRSSHWSVTVDGMQLVRHAYESNLLIGG